MHKITIQTKQRLKTLLGNDIMMIQGGNYGC